MPPANVVFFEKGLPWQSSLEAPPRPAKELFFGFGYPWGSARSTKNTVFSRVDAAEGLPKHCVFSRLGKSDVVFTCVFDVFDFEMSLLSCVFGDFSKTDKNAKNHVFLHVAGSKITDPKALNKEQFFVRKAKNVDVFSTAPKNSVFTVFYNENAICTCVFSCVFCDLFCRFCFLAVSREVFS